MRRTARFLSATALVSVVLGAAASAAIAEPLPEPPAESWAEAEPDADPAAEPGTAADAPVGDEADGLGDAGTESAGAPAARVSPVTVGPGGTITISVDCEAGGGTAPESIDANSGAFEQGKVQLHRVPGEGGQGTAPAAYRGTARISSGEDSDGSVEDGGDGREWNVDGTCPAAPGKQGRHWSTSFTHSWGDASEPGRDQDADTGGAEDMGGAGDAGGAEGGGDPGDTAGAGARGTVPPADEARRGAVRAGQGGAFTDSVPALITGGVLVAGAVGAGVHRMLRRSGQGVR
ncbi:hypothetical protein ACFY93_07770 [Streptomyces sp. NPDC008313]|uniref:hypothetical protein n=1 Tax=Streptomyces sp. NPDC008313 TaxID=3364826 RepID=UPI0036E077E7